MKKVLITNYKTGYQSGTFAETESEKQAYIDRMIAKKQLWKDEREIIEFSESYEPTDILSTRSETVDEVTTNYVTLKAEYVIDEKDLSIDPEWLLAECYRKRQAEYPTIQEIGEAIMEKFGENRSGKFDELHAKRISVKNKYPKP